MPYPHGADCRCPPMPPGITGLLHYSVDCDHHLELMVALSKLAGRPDASTLPVLEAAPAPPPPINRNPAPQPWQPRPSRRSAALQGLSPQGLNFTL